MPDEWSWDSWYHDYDLSRAAIQRAEKLQVDATLAWHAYWNEILDDPDLAREAGFNLRHRILEMAQRARLTPGGGDSAAPLVNQMPRPLADRQMWREGGDSLFVGERMCAT